MPSSEKPKLQEKDFIAAAKKIRCSVADVKTVEEVESKGEAFYDDGFPVILFERHKFHKFTGGVYSRKYPAISNPKAGGYGKAGQNQRNKFNLAFSLDPEAAMKSCSWGKFQIMGFNFALCGFKSVGEFVDAMKTSEVDQLKAFVNYILACGLGDELRNHKWESFAEQYNGPDYKKNDYHIKLPAAHKKFSRQAKFSTDLQPAPVTPSKPAYKSVENPPNQIEEIRDEEAEISEQQTTEQSETENGGGKIESLIDSAKEKIGGQINTAVEQATDRIQDSVKDAVAEAKESARGKATDYVTQKLPNFAKTARWLQGLSVTGFLGFLGSYLAGLPWWLMFGFGYLAGVASTGFVVFLLVKTNYLARVTVKVAEANADPLQNNIKLVQLPPSPGWISKLLARFRQTGASESLSINS